MTGHRQYARPRSSGRVRAVLAFGAVLGLGVIGTAASWTDAAPITGTTFTSGTIDLQVNEANSTASSTLSMANMVPGASSAEVFRVKNAGSTALTYTISGGLGGTDATDYATAASLRLSIYLNGTRAGTGNAATCTGGTALATDVGLTATTTTTIVGTAQGPLAVGAAIVQLCFQVTLAATAPSTLQGKAATATFTVTGTSSP